jgi:tetratricopeptide (TPR) repeat protein
VRIFKFKDFLSRLLAAILFLIFGVFNCAHALNVNKVKVYFLSGDYRAAISEGERLIARDEYSSELYYFLGVSYLKEGNYQRSSDNFKIVINNFKDSKFKEESRIGLADTYLLREDFSNARRLYKELIDENPKIKFKEQISSRLSDIEAKNTIGLRYDLPGPYYSVQVGSFSSINNARNFTQKLVNSGYPAYMEGSKPAYRVKVGKIKTRSQAEQLSKKLSRQGYPTKICP